MPSFADIANPVSLGLGILGGIGQIINSGAQQRRLRRLLKSDPTYQTNPIARERYGLAQTLLNARMPGAAQAERNIYGTQASNIANINRNATDASQALALAAGTQGQTNQSFQNLGMAEAQDYQRRYGNLTGAQEGMIAEGDKEYNDRVRRFQNQLAAAGAGAASSNNAFGNISNMGFGLANFGMAGGWDSMFGGGGRGGGGYGKGVRINF